MQFPAFIPSPKPGFTAPHRAGLLSAAVMLGSLSAASGAFAAGDSAPPVTHEDPASACAAADGEYLGDLKCQLADGSVAQVLAGPAATRARMSITPVAPGSPHAWALAVTAITFEYNEDRHDTLTGEVAVLDGIRRAQKTLSDWWGIENHEELMRTLQWLQFKGHRAKFAELGARVDRLTDLELRFAMAALATSPDDLAQAKLARQYHRSLASKGILAWDLVRYVGLCRSGVLAGYLQESDAWELIMPAALRLQASFGSWGEMEEDFLVGREFWSPEETENTGADFRKIYAKLLQDAGSPWNQNPWNMDLGVATPLPIVAEAPHTAN